MRNLILLEDEPVLRREIAEFFREQGWLVSEAGSLAEFDEQLQIDSHSVAIIDLGLPDGNGLDLITRLRAQCLPLGIIVLTAWTAEADRLAGLLHGADHYLSKNISLEILGATASALLRRLSMGGLALDWVLSSRGRKLNPPGHSTINLSCQDYAVLHILMSAAGNVVSRREIVEKLGSNYLTTDPARLDTQMRRLRKKVIDAVSTELPIKTLRNQGYQFYAPVRVQD